MTFKGVFKKKLDAIEGVLSYPVTNSTTKEVTGFYHVEPFPNYSNAENKLSIVEKGESNLFAKELKDTIGYNKSFLEVGAGTCQLSNYLAIGTNNKIYALDPTIESISLGKNFAEKNSILNVTFVRADIFDDVFNPESFDVVWCSGVLHHTNDPRKGFEVISKYVKKNGLIIVGLYNKYGRIRTHIRRYLCKILGNQYLMAFDPVLRKMNKVDERKINSWIRDQYKHPVESTHSFDEVIEWFHGNNIEFISSYPSCELSLDDKKEYFKKRGMGRMYERILQQIAMIFSPLGGEGGLFVFIGRKV
jgi:SAM-dependent methyltransferase